jgi:hypothetical protein
VFPILVSCFFLKSLEFRSIFVVSRHSLHLRTLRVKTLTRLEDGREEDSDRQHII